MKKVIIMGWTVELCYNRNDVTIKKNGMTWFRTDAPKDIKILASAGFDPAYKILQLNFFSMF